MEVVRVCSTAIQRLEQGAPLSKSEALQPMSGVLYAFAQAVGKPLMGWKSERLMDAAIAVGRGVRRRKRARGRVDGRLISQLMK